MNSDKLLATAADKSPPSQPSGKINVVDRLISKTISCLPFFSFCLMTYSAATAIRDTNGDPQTVTFVVASFTLIVLLYFSMFVFDRNRHASTPAKSLLLKAVIWSLSVAITALFSHRVVTLINSPILNVFVWSLGAVTAATGFYLLFVL